MPSAVDISKDCFNVKCSSEAGRDGVIFCLNLFSSTPHHLCVFESNYQLLITLITKEIDHRLEPKFVNGIRIRTQIGPCNVFGASPQDF